MIDSHIHRQSSSHLAYVARTMMLLVIVCILSTTIIMPMAINAESVATVPTRWDFPTPMDWTLTVNDTGPTRNIILQLEGNLDGSLRLFGDIKNCYFQLNDESTLYEIAPTIHVNGDLITASADLGEQKTIDKVRWMCSSLTLKNPLDTANRDTQVILTFGVKYESDGEVKGEDKVHLDLANMNRPMLSHDYRWAQSGASMITVMFTFYRPSEMESTEFIIDHPFLDVSKITTMHGQDISKVNDLQRPYHLLTLDIFTAGISCQNKENDQLSANLSVQSVNPDGSSSVTGTMKPVLEVPSNALSNAPYICSFGIDYPPDVLASMSKDDPGVTIYTTKTGSGDDDRVEHNLPPSLDLFPDAGDKSNGVHIWISSHHSHEDIFDFEFGIAVTDYYYELPSDDESDDEKTAPILHHIVSPIYGLKFTASTMEPMTTISMLSSGSMVKCRHHYHDGEKDSEWEIWNIVDDEVLPLRDLQPRGFGKTCQVFLPNDKRDGFLPTADQFQLAASIIASEHHINSIEVKKVTIIDQFYRPTLSDFVYLHDLQSINSSILPAPVPVPFTREEINGIPYAIGRFHVQSLLPDPRGLGANDGLTLQIVFTDSLYEPSLIDGDSTASITVMKGFYPIASNEEVRSLTISVDMQPILNSHDVDDVHTILRHGGPIRSPVLRFSDLSNTPITLDAAQPLHVVVKFPITDDIELDDVSIYPMLLPLNHISTGTYSPMYARVTPARMTPLRGYLYKCVAWDRMAAPYVYGKDNPLKMEDFADCPSYRQGNIINSKMWRSLKSILPNGETRCMYELAAVCVTPSTTVEDEFIVHPLADCPSLLGAIHAVPCSLVGGDGGGGGQQEWDYHIPHLTANLSSPELDEERDYVHKSRSVTLWWSYVGDPRVTMTVFIKPLLAEGDNDSGDDSNDDNNDNDHDIRGWIPIARDIPAYLSPTIPEPEPQPVPATPGVTIGFPILNPLVEQVRIRLTVNGVPSVHQTTQIRHTMEDAPWGESQTGCQANAQKTFDDVTHLCKCANDSITSTPIGLESPLVHPLDFKCNPRVPPNEIPSTSEQCHSVPEGVKPPYLTQQCGYGFAVNTTNGKCKDCECFSAWDKGVNDPQRCMQCKLEDICVVNQTESFTFQPKYCLVGRCLCRAGYSGNKCQYTVMYGTLAYHDVATDEQKASLINATKESPLILSRRQITTFQPRVTNNVKASLGDTPVEAFVQQATQVLSADGQEVITSIMVALGRLTDADVSPSPSPFMMSATTSASPFTFAAGDGTNSNDLGDLHYAWEQLQNNYQDRPVYKDDEYGTLNGGVGSAYDPHCVPNAFTYCPDGKEDDLLPPESQVDEDELQDIYEEPSSTDHTTTYIIIGVVVGIILLLFIALIVSILYCRKHDKMCFRKRKSKGKTGLSKSGSGRNSDVNSQTELTKGTSITSAPPPSSTMSTSSYLPTQVQVDDPTLPADWIALEDKSTGKIYYSNKMTMESSWDHPAQPKAKAKSAYGW